MSACGMERAAARLAAARWCRRHNNSYLGPWPALLASAYTQPRVRRELSFSATSLRGDEGWGKKRKGEKKKLKFARPPVPNATPDELADLRSTPRKPPTDKFAAAASASAVAAAAAREEGPTMESANLPAGAAIEAPRSYGKAFEGEFTPKPLPRPIGMPDPPNAGENRGIDTRSMQQRRIDFVDYDKHMERRKYLTQKIAEPYFRDWGNLRFEGGKSFLAPPRLFKAQHSLFFPNLYGEALLLKRTDRMRDTTPIFHGRVSVVVMYSNSWAQSQVDTFISAERNAALPLLVSQNSDVAQVIHINFEENMAKRMLIRMFKHSTRKRFAEEDWGKYLMVRSGISDYIRECIGLLNFKVGYVYLVDSECRIRWAGSGRANPDEQQSLVNGLSKLASEVRGSRTPAPAPRRVQT